MRQHAASFSIERESLSHRGGIVRCRLYPSRHHGRPNAIQVADRWHLMENASAAFLTVVQRSMQVIRKVVGSDVINLDGTGACAERRAAFRLAAPW